MFHGVLCCRFTLSILKLYLQETFMTQICGFIYLCMECFPNVGLYVNHIMIM